MISNEKVTQRGYVWSKSTLMLYSSAEHTKQQRSTPPEIDHHSGKQTLPEMRGQHHIWSRETNGIFSKLFGKDQNGSCYITTGQEEFNHKCTKTLIPSRLTPFPKVYNMEEIFLEMVQLR